MCLDPYVMRSATLVGVAVAALATAATALATSQQYNGPAGSSPNAGVEFGGKLSGGHPVSVRRFAFFNIPAQCTGSGPTAVSDSLSITMRVTAQHTFKGSGSLSGGKATAKVTGRFSSSFAKATGTLRVSGTVAGCRTADTGVVKWSAPKVGKAH
jgi:hypothetical protein